MGDGNFDEALKAVAAASENCCLNYYKSIKPKLPPTKNVPYTMVQASILIDEVKKIHKLKHLYKPSGLIKYVKDDPLLSINLAFYSSLVNIDAYKYGVDYDDLKAISHYALSHGPDFEDFNKWVGIEQMYGWRESKVDIKKLVDDWVVKEFHPNWKGSEDEFNRRFRLAVRTVLNWKEGEQEQTSTAEDFVANVADTGTSGSAFDPGGERLEAEVMGTTFKPSNNKYSKSMKLSVKEKLKRLFAHAKQKCRVSEKREIYPKVRIIVSSDYNTTLKMRFVGQWLDKWMSGNKNSTLWMTSDQLKEMWEIFCSGSKKYKVPLDQSKFDHHVSKRMMMIMLEEIQTLIGNKCPTPEEYVEVMTSIMFALDGGSVIFSSGNDPGTTSSVEYKNGILSGWQWTAFLDTLANIAEKLMAEDMVRELIPIEGGYFNAQGDDQYNSYATMREALAYIFAMNAMGFEVHPTKNFISTIHDEYLRRYSTTEGSNGYPTRMVNSMLWLYPGQTFVKDKVQRMRAMFENWKKMSERCFSTSFKLVGRFKQDAIAAKIPSEFINWFLNSPISIGGSGLGIDTSHTIQRDSKPAKNVTFLQAKGLDDFKLRYGENQNRELMSWARSVAGIPNEIKNIEITPDPEYKLQAEAKLTPMPVVILNDVLMDVIFKSKEPINTLYGSDDKLFERYFDNFENKAKSFHAPKSWIKDLAAGRIKSVTPLVEGLSTEMSSLLSAKYVPSLINAMLHKSTRTSNKWIKIQLYAESKIPTLIQPQLKYKMYN